MSKSLGHYAIDKSSSSDIENIKWTQKNPTDTDKSKNKKKTITRIPTLSIVHNTTSKKIKPSVEKIFKIERIVDDNKSKNKKKTIDKRFQNSSASNCKIKQGFKRPAR